MFSEKESPVHEPNNSANTHSRLEYKQLQTLQVTPQQLLGMVITVSDTIFSMLEVLITKTKEMV